MGGKGKWATDPPRSPRERGPQFEQFQRGDTVSHPAYGEGTVVSQHEDLVFCAFEHGRTLTVRVGQLTRVEREQEA